MIAAVNVRRGTFANEKINCEKKKGNARNDQPPRALQAALLAPPKKNPTSAANQRKQG